MKPVAMRVRATLGVSCLCAALLALPARAQDIATGAIRGTVEDPSGARIMAARVIVTHLATAFRHAALTDNDGSFAVQLLPPGEYAVAVSADNMAPQSEPLVRVDLGAVTELSFRLQLATARAAITVTEPPGMVQVQTSHIASVLDTDDTGWLPLNGRRFQDLALLTPGVNQDPRGLTSSSNGDLAFGGVRGLHSSYLVDGGDNNNAFFAQARGRYRAPYQFSNEVIQEFRVSSNSYEAELGRAGGGVINVVTRSGTNDWHGNAFYYLRDAGFNARYPFLDYKPADRQQQFGATLGGPIRKNRVFVFAGFDQHIFDVPNVVRFLTGYSTLMPSPADFEASDYSLVMLAAQSLSTLGGEYRTLMAGNAGFLKLDFSLSPRHLLSARLSTSRYWGQNNVFFDPASPVTTFSTSENGEEDVSTETAVVSLTSSLLPHLTSHLRVQFSRDLQQSWANSAYPLTRIYGVTDGFGRSTILPRRTREHRLYLGDTFSRDGLRHTFKFGGDFIQTWVYNFFPSLTGGEYIFDDIHVDPWTFQPTPYGMEITPLRAYAHQVPRYYMQNFGVFESHPDTREYAAFLQDSIRINDHFALSLGVRYDYQSFPTANLLINPLWPASGHVPVDNNNVAPRLGFALSFGERRPLLIRGGYGLFYTRIPSMYTSAVETDNGASQSHLFLDNTDFYDHQVFPAYPRPLVSCAPSATRCLLPASLAGKVSTQISAFASNFQIPFVQQTSLSMEREVAEHTALGVSYLYVHGQHLIRARDANLPAPLQLQYPLYDETGLNFLGQYYTVDSFTDWQMVRSQLCPFPPCLGDLVRPISQLGEIDVFESAASSVYHGMTVSARRRMRHGYSFRLAYTWARALDDGQDALVVGRPATVQNSYLPNAERALSVTDQRHRLMTSWVVAPQPFHREHQVLRLFFNDWRMAGVITFGSGRPVNARITGDANRDSNTYNDRLPGYRRNSFTGPTYSTTDFRLTRTLYLNNRLRMELLAEAFNLWNRANLRVETTDDGFLGTAGNFVVGDVSVRGRQFPAYYKQTSSFLEPTSAYAPRQVQFALRLTY